MFTKSKNKIMMSVSTQRISPISPASRKMNPSYMDAEADRLQLMLNKLASQEGSGVPNIPRDIVENITSEARVPLTGIELMKHLIETTRLVDGFTFRLSPFFKTLFPKLEKLDVDLYGLANNQKITLGEYEKGTLTDLLKKRDFLDYMFNRVEFSRRGYRDPYPYSFSYNTFENPDFKTVKFLAIGNVNEVWTPTETGTFRLSTTTDLMESLSIVFNLSNGMYQVDVKFEDGKITIGAVSSSLIGLLD